MRKIGFTCTTCKKNHELNTGVLHPHGEVDLGEDYEPSRADLMVGSEGSIYIDVEDLERVYFFTWHQIAAYKNHFRTTIGSIEHKGKESDELNLFLCAEIVRNAEWKDKVMVGYAKLIRDKRAPGEPGRRPKRVRHTRSPERHSPQDEERERHRKRLEEELARNGEADWEEEPERKRGKSKNTIRTHIPHSTAPPPRLPNHNNAPHSRNTTGNSTVFTTSPSHAKHATNHTAASKVRVPRLAITINKCLPKGTKKHPKAIPTTMLNLGFIFRLQN